MDMKKSNDILKINFVGGIISPGQLRQILQPAFQMGIWYARFGLRQQLLLDTSNTENGKLEKELTSLGVDFEQDIELYPNIVSSYPAADVFEAGTWLNENAYGDVFDLFDYRPQLKVNICSQKQSFTPFFTGNLNWIASNTTHFWYLYVRFPKTNVIFEWKELIYTNDIGRVSKAIEAIIFKHKALFYNNEDVDGELLYQLMQKGENFITKPILEMLVLPPFTLPYYEGFNRYGDKTWLGIYRRDEFFSVKFLLDICEICLQTKIGQICVTNWKSLIIKGIEQEERKIWDKVLGQHQINVRHAANELNWQVEDHNDEGLELKQDLVAFLNNNDVRTFGLAFAVQTHPKSELFGSVMIRKKPLIRIGSLSLIAFYDILYAEDFNPNSRKLRFFEKNLFRFHLGEQLKKLSKKYYALKNAEGKSLPTYYEPADESIDNEEVEYIYQCNVCFTVYDEKIGEPENGIKALTLFGSLPSNYCCPLCESGKEVFAKVERRMILAV